MWEGSLEENSMERNIMKKMRKGRVAKGMQVNYGKDVKENALKVFAAKYRFNPKEEQWILDNDKDDSLLQ